MCIFSLLFVTWWSKKKECGLIQKENKRIKEDRKHESIASKKETIEWNISFETLPHTLSHLWNFSKTIASEEWKLETSKLN